MNKLLRFSLMLLMTMLCGVVSAQDVFTFSDMGYENAESLDGIEMTVGDAKVVFAKNEGNNNPAYYTTGTAARLYSKNTLTISSTKPIKGITFVTGTGNNAFGSNQTWSVGTFADNVWTGEANEITVTHVGTSGHVRIQSIKVSYEEVVAVDITNTPETAYTATEAGKLIAAGEGLNASVYVKGKISSIDEISANYGNATYTITDGSEELKVYRGFGLEGAKFESEDALHVGDDVVVYGNLVNFNGVYEVATGNKLHSLVCNYVAPEVPSVNLEATFTAINNTVELTYPDYINGAVAPGKGNPEIWNEVMKVADCINGAEGTDFNQVVYELSATVEPGSYIIKVPAGAVVGNKTNAFGKMTAIEAAEARVEITAAPNTDSQEIELATLFGKPSVAITGNSVKYTYPDSQEYLMLGNSVEKMLGEDRSVTLRNADMENIETVVMTYDDNQWAFLANFTNDVEGILAQGGSIFFHEGIWVINQFDEKTGEVKQSFASPACSYPMESEDEQPSEGGWTFAGVTPAEGAVESLSTLTFAYPEGVGWTNEYPYVSMLCPDGKTVNVMLADNFQGACIGTVIDAVLSASGTYTLTIPAGILTSNLNEPCAAMTFTWTIGGGTEGGETPDTPGDVTGKKWQEAIFNEGTAVAIPLNIDTDGVTVTSVGRDFMGTTIDVSYNMYEEGELDWKNGTKLVFTAKDNITGIVIDGQFKEFASADKGVYTNGAWTGTLAAGESLTLTANDGINIHKITVLYNGAELNIDDVEDVDAEITLNVTKTSWSKIGATNGETIGTVSSNVPNFDHYMFMITNDDDPSQVITFADLLSIEGPMTCYSPDSKGYDLYEGQNYTLHAYAYDTPQYGAIAVAEAEYKFVGTGAAAIVYNNEITVTGISLKENAQGLGYNQNGTTFDVTFSAPVATVQAYAAMGMDGSVKATAAKKDAEGKVWTITIPESLLSGEGSFNMNIVATDAAGLQLAEASDVKPYAFDVVVNPEEEPEPEQPVLANLDFSAGEPCTVNVRTYAKDIVDAEVSGLQEVTGWTAGENGDARAATVFAYGSDNFLGGAGYTAPAAGPQGEAGQAFGVVAVWTGVAQYTQDVTLAPGSYIITMPTYNSVGGSQAITKNLFGFIANDGTEYLATEKTWAANQWTDMTVSFTLTEETAGKLSLGYAAANAGNANQPHLFIDGINIQTVSELDLAKAEALSKIPAAGEGLFAYETAALNAIAEAIENATNVEEVESAISTLADLKTPAEEGTYTIYNVSAENYLGEAKLSAEEVAVEFIKAEGGYYIKMGDQYINMAGNNTWSMNVGPEPTTAWNFTLADGAYTIKGPNGLIGTDNTAAGSATYGNKAVANNGLWTIEAIVPETIVATLTIGDQTCNLSEKKSVELASYPEGAVITVCNNDEAIKKVTYEVIDLTKNEILKSQGDLTKGEDGTWKAEMPRTYALAKGHEYSVHVKALNGMSSFTSKVLYEYNFLLTGTAVVKEYSTIQLAGFTPAESEIITDDEPVLTFTFDSAIEKLAVGVNVAQMDTRDVPAGNITSNDDKTVWTVTIPNSYMTSGGMGGSLSLHVEAIDAEGNFVYDERNSVGTPEKSYISLSWATTVGLPVPQLAENGKELESVTSLTFKYDGIGLNQDKNTATWKNIVIAKDGEPLNIALTESMFAVGGDESNGGTALVLTLPSALEAGQYTVSLPAMAFMLGHDQSNFNSGKATYSFTVVATEPEIAVVLTKTDWSKIGSQNGEVIGTAQLKNSDFDHIEAEIRCAEDPDQYISFSNLLTNGGNLTCYAWEGGSYTLNEGYHYTLIVNGFDVPYYGVAPVATYTYEFVGTGAKPTKYCDIEVAKIDLEPNPIVINGYNSDGNTFDVTFTEPVSKVVAWAALGFDGSLKAEAAKKSDDGTVWTITFPESLLADEGSINFLFQAWNADGIQAKGHDGDHAFGINLVIKLTDPEETAIQTIIAQIGAEGTVYTVNGSRVKAGMMKSGRIYIVNGKKVLVK